MKKKSIILIVIVAVVALLFIGKDLLIKTGVEQAVKAVTGLPLRIDSLRVGVTTSLIDIKGLKLYNPDGFEEKLMMSIPVIYVDYELLSVLTGTVHVTDLRLHLEKFIVVKNKDGDVNLEYLKTIQKQEEVKKEVEEEKVKPEKKEIQIDNLALRVDKVVYKDYSRGAQPQVREFNIGIDQTYKDITNLNTVVSIIVVRSIAQTTIANFIDLDITGLSSVVSGTLKGATATTRKMIGGTTDTTKKVIDETADTLKDTTDKIGDMFKNPFGSEE